MSVFLTSMSMGYMCLVLEGTGFPGIWAADGCETLCEYRALNLGPLEKQVLLIWAMFPAIANLSLKFSNYISLIIKKKRAYYIVSW